VLLGGTSTDFTSGVAQVEVSFDNGATWQLAGTSSPWSFTWHTRDQAADTPSGGEGHPILARTRDTAGNLSPAVTVHLKVDNTPPDLTLPNTPMGYDPSLTHFLSSDTASGLDHGQVTISGNGIAAVTIYYPTLHGDETIHWDGLDRNGRPVPPGMYDVLIEVWDCAQNHASLTGQWARPAPPTETLSPTRLPTGTPPPAATATGTRAPVRSTATGTRPPGASPTATSTRAPFIIIDLPPIPPGIPIALLFLPAAAAAFWLVASGVAFTRDRRGAELRALRRSVADYLSQSKTNSQGGEDND
jgi:hypothetical protein